MIVTVLYLVYLCYEQSPHRLLNIETSIGCSCVQISLDLSSHDNHLFLTLDTLSLFKTEPTVALGQIALVSIETYESSRVEEAH